MCSQSQGIGSADISVSTYDKIRTIPARLHCASHGRGNDRVQLPAALRERHPWQWPYGAAGQLQRLVKPPSLLTPTGMLPVAVVNDPAARRNSGR